MMQVLKEALLLPWLYVYAMGGTRLNDDAEEEQNHREKDWCFRARDSHGGGRMIKDAAGTLLLGVNPPGVFYLEEFVLFHHHHISRHYTRTTVLVVLALATAVRAHLRMHVQMGCQIISSLLPIITTSVSPLRVAHISGSSYNGILRDLSTKQLASLDKNCIESGSVQPHQTKHDDTAPAII